MTVILLVLSQILVQGGVTYRDEPWHKECFLCTGCKVQLAGQPFTTQGEDPYCVKCFSNLYAQKCAACDKPITGQCVLMCPYNKSALHYQSPQLLTETLCLKQETVSHKQGHVFGGC